MHLLRSITFRAFTVSALLGLATTQAAPGQSNEQAAMQECAAQVDRQALSGDARKGFMRECMAQARTSLNAQGEQLALAERSVAEALAQAVALLRARGQEVNEARLTASQEQWNNYKTAQCSFEESFQSGGKIQDQRRRVDCLINESTRRVAFLRQLAA